jgi:hypothetical protein
MADLLAGHDRSISHDELRKRSVRATMWFVREYLGFLREPFDPEGDVITFEGMTVDVKCVGAGLPTITGHAKHRPRSLGVIVEAYWSTTDGERFVHVGTVQPEAWRWDTPPYRDARPCWMVGREEVGPVMVKPTGSKRAFQIQAFVPEEIQPPDGSSLLDDPSVPREMTPKERKYWRDKAADQRRRARVKAAKGTGMFFPYDTPRGQGKTTGGKPPVQHDE